MSRVPQTGSDAQTTRPTHSVLIVEDEQSVRWAIRLFLKSHGFDVTEAETLAAAAEAMRETRPDVAIIDYSLPDGNALELMPRLKAIDPSLPVVILTGHGSVDLAVRAIKEGAEHFLTKPVELPTLLVVIQRAMENRRNRQKEIVRRSREARTPADPFLGSSDAIRRFAEEAHRVLEADRPVLIQGDTGSGKGVLAKWLHHNGPRTDETFVDLNCAGLSREFLETELFGHEKGAFTGAASTKPGLIEVAHRGTLFLDEIGDVDQQVQPKLLKVLEEKRFRRLGDVRDRQVDVQLIAATHQNLQQLIRESRFRADLYYRINAVQLRIPALRERGEDVIAIAEHFLAHYAVERSRGSIELAGDARSALREYDWPGNIRELRNVIERAALLSAGPVLTAADLHFEKSAATAGLPYGADLSLRELERLHIERVLIAQNGRVDAAAEVLQIPRSSCTRS